MWFGVIGIMALILSFLYLFRPETIRKMDEFGTKLILTSEKLLEKRKKIGLFYFITGIVLVYIAVWW